MLEMAIHTETQTMKLGHDGMALIAGTLAGSNTYSFLGLLEEVFGVDVPEEEGEEKEIIETAEEILQAEGVITKGAADAEEPQPQTASLGHPLHQIKVQELKGASKHKQV